MDLMIPRIDPTRNYWFLRTSGGQYYNAFLEGGFVAVGWDEFLNLSYLTETPEARVIGEIRAQYPDERRARHAYNQMMRFIQQMQVGDVVIIPSEKSHWLSIGIIESDVYIEDEHPFSLGACPFRKRRKVRWEKRFSRRNLDVHLFPLINSQHTLSTANNYADHIDRMLHSLYIKGDVAHLVINVKTKSGIPTVAFASLLSAILELTPLAAEIAEEDVQPDDIKIRTEVQSPGHIELYSIAAALTIVILGMLIVFIVGGKSKFAFKHTKDVTEGTLEMSSEGLLEKVLKLKHRASKDRIAEIEQRHRHYLDLLELDAPDDLKEYVRKRLEMANTENRRD
ncbi:hypothetical protein [Alicyclobacillus macrosporangiidus]|uniref:hypothetical protein n=1 Tax=Alicyclobacillus macrosporangiidus TaxID=392015 RepID=UPI00055401EF|nr:hypothetical protein [Alicyclobacillus macrosporangiidus]